MPVYHSTLNNDPVQQLCNLSILPIKTKHKGNAPPFTGPYDKDDILDEAIKFFKANILFRNFEVKGGADRLLIYLTLYISQCLLKMVNKSRLEAEKQMYSLAIENFSLPGDRTFPLGGLVTAPQSRADADFLRTYFTQLRQEIGTRLVEKVYSRGERLPDKWWMCFTKRKFLNKSL